MSGNPTPNPALAEIEIRQNPEGYRYSVEPFLLVDWVRPKPGSHILDIGTGCGIIPMLLLSRETDLNITAVEIQHSLYQKAVENLEAFGRTDHLRIIEGDYSEIAEGLPPNSFDWILSNPPYRKINSGKLNPCREKALARHEVALNLETLVAASAPLLKPSGTIALAYPHHRLQEVIAQLEQARLHPTRICRVYGHEQAVPKICLIEATKGSAPGKLQEQTLTTNHLDNSFTQTMQDIYASFNYPERTHRLGEK